MRPAGALSATPFGTDSYGKLLAEAHTTKPPAMNDVGGWWALIVLGFLTAGGGVGVGAGGAPVAVAVSLLAVGLPMLAGGVIMLKKRNGAAGQLRAFENGIEVSTAAGKQLKVTYEQLEGVALEEQELLQNGEHNGWLRTLTLWSKTEQITLRSHIIGGNSDPFGQVLDAILTKEAEQTARSLSAGEVLRGVGWQLDRSGLRLESGLVTPLESFVQTGSNEGRAQAWRKGEEDPFFNVPLGSRNARTALGVIARYLPKDESAREVPGLGRRLFGKGMTKNMRITLWVLTVFFGLPGLIGLAATQEPATLIGVGLGALCGLAAYAGSKGGTSIHERGVRQKGMFGTKELKFLDVETYTHGTTRHYYNGAYTGTSQNLSFIPVAGKGPKITLNHMGKGDDEDMDRLRQAMARIVAQGMYERMKKGVPVKWAGATMARDGIHFFESKLIGKGPPGVLPYAGSRYSFHEGNCFLYPPTGEKHVTLLPCAGANFWPGFELYMVMCSEAQEQQVVAPVRPAAVGNA